MLDQQGRLFPADPFGRKPAPDDRKKGRHFWETQTRWIKEASMNRRLLLAVFLVLSGTVSWAEEPLIPALLPSSQVDLPSDGSPSGAVPPVRVAGDYLFWWIKDGPLNGPLAPNGNPNSSAGPLGTPGAQVLFPSDRFDYGLFSGLKLSVVAPVNDLLSFEKNLFFLEQRSVQWSANPGPDDPLFPGLTAGSSVISHTRFSGWEINSALNARQQQGMTLVLLGGLRVLDLNEDVLIRDQFGLLDPVASGFQGAPLAAGSQVSTEDRFKATNHFYGGQLGARGQFRLGALSLGLQGKLALGTTQQLVIIDGSSTVLGPLTATTPGGLFAQMSNISRNYHSPFAFVPEGLATIGLNLADNVRLTAGYTFLYWSDVVRPGQQIDRVINPALVPTNPASGTSNLPFRPTPYFQTTDFWAQGLTFGVEFSF